MSDWLTDHLCFGHNKTGTLLGEVCRFSGPHIALSRIDRCPRVGEVGQIFASRFLFWLWLTKLTGDSDINVITMRAFISLTELINQNLGSLLLSPITCLVNHKLSLHKA